MLLTNSLGVVGSVRFEMRQDVEPERSIQQLELTYNNSITLKGKVRTSHGPFLHFNRKGDRQDMFKKETIFLWGEKSVKETCFLRI